MSNLGFLELRFAHADLQVLGIPSGRIELDRESHISIGRAPKADIQCIHHSEALTMGGHVSATVYGHDSKVCLNHCGSIHTINVIRSGSRDVNHRTFEWLEEKLHSLLVDWEGMDHLVSVTLEPNDLIDIYAVQGPLAIRLAYVQQLSSLP